MPRREFRDLATPAEARSAIDSLSIDPGVTDVPLGDAAGRTLATRVRTDLDVPGFDRVAMDGYAVRSGDCIGASEGSPVDLPVVDAVHAGEEPTREVSTGEAVQVATGAVLPGGADAVVPVERTIERDGSVAVTTAVAPGDNVMARGADIAAGDPALSAGTRLTPRHVGLLAALGRETVAVRARPRVAVVSTGGELVQPGRPLDPSAGDIYDVNGHSIAAAVERAGGDPVRHPPPADDPETLRTTLADAAADADLVLSSGSTSAGTADLVPDVVAEAGEIRVHGVALKPGRPLLVGRAFDTPFVGLPGYPVSALTVFRTFVAPALRDAVGKPAPARGSVTATLARRVRYDGGRLRLLPVGLVEDGTGSHLAYTLSRGSGATTSLVEADGVVRMAPETNQIHAGDPVTVERFDAGDAIPAVLAVGESDPVASALLDAVTVPRFLSLDHAAAIRWFEDGVPDLLATAPDQVRTGGFPDPEPLATFDRTWGLVVPDESSVAGDDPGTLVDGDTTLANLDASYALRAAFDEWLDATSDGEVATDAIDGYERGLPGLESPARAVADGRADVGLGLEATAAELDLGFVTLGSQRIALVPNPDRREKDGMGTLEAAIDDRLDALLADTPGYVQPSPRQ